LKIHRARQHVHADERERVDQPLDKLPDPAAVAERAGAPRASATRMWPRRRKRRKPRLGAPGRADGDARGGPFDHSMIFGRSDPTCRASASCTSAGRREAVGLEAAEQERRRRRDGRSRPLGEPVPKPAPCAAAASRAPALPCG
jgi:hypothetical protein